MIEQIKARRVILGMTYNTKTSTLLAFSDGGDIRRWIYRTRAGAFFEVAEKKSEMFSPRSGEFQDKIDVDVRPIDHAAAVSLAKRHQAEIIVDFFDLPPGSHVDPKQTPGVIIRMTDLQKADLAAAAKRCGMSMTEYANMAIGKMLKVDRSKGKT